MKKLIILFLTLSMLFALVACDGDKPNNDDPLNRDNGTTQGGEQGNNNPGSQTPGSQTPGGQTPGGQTPGGDIGYGDNIPWPSNEFTNAVPKPNMNIDRKSVV